MDVSVHNVDFVGSRTQQLTLRISNGQILTHEVSQLCALLTAATSTELPCMIFTRPFFNQMKWSASGSLEEVIPDIISLPSWPRDLFRPIKADGIENIIFAPHVFGINTMVNESLIGFTLCEDLSWLVEHGYLRLHTSHSQLMITINETFRSSVHDQMQGPAWFHATKDLCQLTLACVSDPYAEPFWIYNHHVLRPIMKLDVLPSIPLLVSSNLRAVVASDSVMASSESRSKALTNRTILEPHTTRAVLAFYAASASDSTWMNSFISSHMTEYGMSGGSAPIQSLYSFTKNMKELFEFERIIVDQGLQHDRDAEIPEHVCECVSELLYRHTPFGHLAILDFYRKLNNFKMPLLMGSLRRGFLTMLLEIVEIQPFLRPIDLFLRACLLGNHNPPLGQVMFEALPRSNITFVKNVTTIVGASFYQTGLRNFEAAIDSLNLVVHILLQTSSTDLQLLLVCCSELIQCLNAVGDEQSSVDVATQVLSALLQDPSLHRFMYLKVALESPLFKIRFSEAGTIGEQILRSHLSTCASCNLAEARGVNHELVDGHSSIGPDSRQDRGVPSSNSTNHSEQYQLDPNDKPPLFDIPEPTHHNTKVDWIEYNFNAIENLAVVLADAHVGNGDYAKAHMILENLSRAQVHNKSSKFHLTALRLSKVARRDENVTLNQSRHTDLLHSLSNRLDSLPDHMVSFVVDEFETIILHGSSRSSDKNTSGPVLEDLLARLLQHQHLQHDQGEMDRKLSFLHDQVTMMNTSPEEGRSPAEAMFARGSDEAFQSEESLDSMLAQGTETRHVVPSEFGSYESESSTELTSKKDELFLHAASVGDLDLLLDSIRLGANIKATAADGESALHLAAKGGHEHLVLTLLDMGADIKARSRTRYTVLHYAVVGCCTSNIVQQLIEKGADMNALTILRYTALHLAILERHVSNVWLLIQRGAEVNVMAMWRRTPLYSAVSIGHRPTVELLLRNGASPNTPDITGRAPLHQASWMNDVNVAKTLLTYEADVNIRDKDGRTPLHWAAACGHGAVVGTLLDHGADAMAYSRERIRSVKTPLNHPTIPFHYAAFFNPVGFTQKLFLAKHKVYLGIEGDGTLLHHITLWSYSRRAYTGSFGLLDRIVDVQSLNAGLLGPGPERVVDLLLSHHRQSMGIGRFDATTALRCAVGVRGLEVARWYIETYPDMLDALDKKGRTALERAYQYGDTELASFLLEHGARDILRHRLKELLSVSRQAERLRRWFSTNNESVTEE